MTADERTAERRAGALALLNRLWSHSPYSKATIHKIVDELYPPMEQGLGTAPNAEPSREGESRAEGDRAEHAPDSLAALERFTAFVEPVEHAPADQDMPE